MNPMKFTVVLQPEADGGFVVKVPALPGCVSQGDTREEAMRNIEEAAELYIEDCIAAGDTIPKEAETAVIELRNVA
jgi:predicted RNase H-like HicB family nuclease